MPKKYLRHGLEVDIVDNNLQYQLIIYNKADIVDNNLGSHLCLRSIDDDIKYIANMQWRYRFLRRGRC